MASMASMASSSPCSTSGSGSFLCNSNSNSNSNTNYGRDVRAVKFQTTTPNSSSRPTILRCHQQHQHPADPDNDEDHVGRRDMILRSSEIATIGAILNLGGKKPNYLGVQKATGSLALCPATSNCISTSENASDRVHYAPPWNYNPEEGRRSKNPVTGEQAMQELLEVIESTRPDNFTPLVMEKKDDYVRVEYQSPILGLVDDVEFWLGNFDSTTTARGSRHCEKHWRRRDGLQRAASNLPRLFRQRVNDLFVLGLTRQGKSHLYAYRTWVGAAEAFSFSFRWLGFRLRSNQSKNRVLSNYSFRRFTFACSNAMLANTCTRF